MSGGVQLGLLVGLRVYDSEGRKPGRVDEIRLVREDDRYEVEGLLIGVNGLVEQFVAAQPPERVEGRLNRCARRMEDHIDYWEQIEFIEERCIRLNVRREEIRTLQSND